MGADTGGRPESADATPAKHWDEVAGGWAAWLAWTERNFEPVTRWFSDAAGWAPGARVLDAACGAGYPALAAAARIGPAGTVVATDISDEMIAATARAAQAAGLDNIRTVRMDAAGLRFADETFDAVSNAYGLMFCPDLPRALSEAHRVLRRGGRFACATWAGPAENPFFLTILRAAGPLLGVPPPSAGAPGPFRLAVASELESLLRDAGLADVHVDAVPSLFECASADQYRQIFTDVAWAKRVSALSADDRRRLDRAVASAVEPFTEADGRVRLMTTTLGAVGRKA